MTLLLDTHALIWSLHAPDRLSPAAREAIEDERNAVFFSSASIWEIAIKTAKGKIEIEGDLLGAIEAAGFVELPIRASHAWLLRQLPPVHADPFDRMLLVQAKADNLTFVTRDGILGEYGVAVIEA